jgi:hypothetical protein
MADDPDSFRTDVKKALLDLIDDYNLTGVEPEVAMEARAAAKQIIAGVLQNAKPETGTVDTLAQDFRILSGFGPGLSRFSDPTGRAGSSRSPGDASRTTDRAAGRSPSQVNTPFA